ncbi:AcrR family transcriptional regulator [Salirhabdus euzebyi]|uniref:AcrR family transcriptional regulator n=1 Tax=Salirhabdus euzebyi TaxID=394506 RepID=A0A841PT21_9BACI|nr:forespore capture DNA-binding protein RefZ [Salirhabdus euzebyi]MBB6452127.1 AcrR family transcriptional regulator [Salirhabdus euzebyi]
MSRLKTKDKVAETAAHLFYLKGFHGTSVRDIATKAKVNVSMISYYFQNKQGLLEYLIVSYYEKYLEEIEHVQKSLDSTHNPLENTYKLIEAIIHYKQKHHQFTCFIQRELSMDNILVRELLVTYLAKEKYLIEDVFDRVIYEKSYTTIEKECLFMQFKGLLNVPYTMPYEWQSMVKWDLSKDAYMKNYTNTIKLWLKTLAAS